MSFRNDISHPLISAPGNLKPPINNCQWQIDLGTFSLIPNQRNGKDKYESPSLTISQNGKRVDSKLLLNFFKNLSI